MKLRSREALSTRAVMVTSALHQAGTFVHLCETPGFLTLHAIRARDGNADTQLEVVEGNRACTIRVQVGRESYAMLLQVPARGATDTRILSDFYMYEGEEVWVACDAPNEWLVHGSVSA